MPRHFTLTLERWVAIYQKKKLKEPLCALRKATKRIQEGYRPPYNLVALLGNPWMPI